MSLIDRILEMDNLTDAWLRVEGNRGAAGVDGVSIRRFARNWEENLRRLRDLVQTHRYRPARLRRVVVPKPQGGGQRLFSIPVVADRVLQRAVLNVIDDRFDREFLECSYGYRAGRGLRQAVAALLRCRDLGLTWVLDTDIDDCFGSLDHELLFGFLAETLTDPAVLDLMHAWLTLPSPQRSGRHADSRRPNALPSACPARPAAASPPNSNFHPLPSNLQLPTRRGIALGSPVSPLCCNVYLHRLDRELVRSHWHLVRYADDFVVCCAGQKQAQQALAVVTDVLADLKLRLEPAKTRITSFDQGFDFLGVRFYRDTYTFLWEGKEIEGTGPVPNWLWGYMPDGYGEERRDLRER